MTRRSATLALAAVAAALPAALWNVPALHADAQEHTSVATTAPAGATGAVPAVFPLAENPVEERWRRDLAAMETFRPGYAFWRHIFTIPDGSIAFGSAVDGRLLAVFPARGDWKRGARWAEPALAVTLAGESLSSNLSRRREQVAELLEEAVGPVVHNATRGSFVVPNARRFGSFLGEWGAIYERFGVPAELGLAQVLIESGFSGTRRSEARAIGFCQWLQTNWKRLDSLATHVVLEAQNQTTQAPYCAAYLSVLATRYGSFIPALSEHHSGGTNVGRTLINGERLGGLDVRERYFMGSALARDLRSISLRGYREIYRTYGPRSCLYSEMVFGNMYNVRAIAEQTPQDRIYAMRTRRAIPLSEVTRRTGLSVDEVRRFNPALIRQVPARATLYLPSYVEAFGEDVAFWHEPPSPAYAAALNDFLRLHAPVEDWDNPAFEPILRVFERRFRETGTEEGAVMATVIAYAIEDAYTSRRGEILAEFRESERVRELFARGVLERDAALETQELVPRAASLD